MDIHRELTQCVRTWIFSKFPQHWDFTLCPSWTVASTFHPRQYLQLLEISIQISCVVRGIKRAILRKLVKMSSILKTVPGCRVYLDNAVLYYCYCRRRFYNAKKFYFFLKKWEIDRRFTPPTRGPHLHVRQESFRKKENFNSSNVWFLSFFKWILSYYFDFP